MKSSRKLFSSLLSIGVFCMLLLSCSQAPRNVSSEIEQVNNKIMDAFAKADVNALSDCYTTDAKIYPANMPIVEGEGIKNYWQGSINFGFKKLTLKTVSAQAIGNMAIEEGLYDIYFENDFLVDQGKYMVVWKKVDGVWKMQKDIYNSSKPAPIARAAENDTVWIFTNQIKANKVNDFERYNNELLAPAAKEFFSKPLKSVRILRPSEPNEDGTYTYYYLIDPVMQKTDYRMKPILVKKYGEEKAQEYIDLFTSCLVNGKQEGYAVIETKW